MTPTASSVTLLLTPTAPAPGMRSAPPTGRPSDRSLRGAEADSAGAFARQFGTERDRLAELATAATPAAASAAHTPNRAAKADTAGDATRDGLQAAARPLVPGDMESPLEGLADARTDLGAAAQSAGHPAIHAHRAQTDRRDLAQSGPGSIDGSINRSTNRSITRTTDSLDSIDASGAALQRSPHTRSQRFASTTPPLGNPTGPQAPEPIRGEVDARVDDGPDLFIAGAGRRTDLDAGVGSGDPAVAHAGVPEDLPALATSVAANSPDGPTFSAARGQHNSLRNRAADPRIESDSGASSPSSGSTESTTASSASRAASGRNDAARRHAVRDAEPKPIGPHSDAAEPASTSAPTRDALPTRSQPVRRTKPAPIEAGDLPPPSAAATTSAASRNTANSTSMPQTGVDAVKTARATRSADASARATNTTATTASARSTSVLPADEAAGSTSASTATRVSA